MRRPEWDEYFLKLAMLASERATCPRMHCGCVLVKNKDVIATGYNGSIPGDDHCDQVGCLIVENHCVRTVHAEMNALIQAAKRGHAVAFHRDVGAQTHRDADVVLRERGRVGMTCSAAPSLRVRRERTTRSH